MNVLTYRRKPGRFELVAVDDILRAATMRWTDMDGWIGAAYSTGRLMIHTHDVTLTTDKGFKTATAGDYVLRLPDGRLDVVSGDDFVANYERIEEENEGGCHAIDQEGSQDQARHGEELRQEEGSAGVLR